MVEHLIFGTIVSVKYNSKVEGYMRWYSLGQLLMAMDTDCTTSSYLGE